MSAREQSYASQVDRMAALLNDHERRIAILERARGVAALWYPLTLAGTFTPAPGFMAPEYRRIGGVVQLRGVVTGGDIPNTLTTLPPGHRPDFITPCLLVAQRGVGNLNPVVVRADVLANGDLILREASQPPISTWASGFIVLNALWFRVTL